MISTIEIRGYKSIKNQIVKLRPLNILIGGNGVGKSNFISVFSLVRNLYEGTLQNYLIKKGGSDHFLYSGSKITDEIFVSFTFQLESLIQNSVEFTLQNGTNSLFIKELNTGFKASDEKWFKKNYEKNIPESSFSQIKDGQAWYINKLLKDFEVYHFHDTSDTSPIKKGSAINDNRYLKKDGSNLASFLYYLHQKHINHFRRIEKAVQSIAPFFSRFVLEPNKLNPEYVLLEWLENNNYENIFNAHNLSDGTLRFICIATLLLQPEPPKTIIIDEPELGLHPIAINKLCDLFKMVSENGIQVVISTQSVTLLDNFEVEDIIITERKDNSTVFRRLKADELEISPKEYSLGEIWEKNIIGGLPF